MFKISQSAVLSIAEETRTAVNATDRALHANAQLLVSLVESAAESDVPVAITQRIYARAHASSGKLVEGRQNLCDLIAAMTAVKNNSEHRETAIGCPKGAPAPARGVEFFTGATLADDVIG